MRDLITSGVRTAVQVAVAGVAIWATARGIDVDWIAVEFGIIAVTTGFVTFALNWAGNRWPIVATILSLGLTTTGPSYKA